jgi:hypothetical protein
MRVDNYRDDQRELYSVKVRAGKRTYIFDVRATRGNDFYITITERKKRQDGDGFQKQKLFLYKEDFNKFLKSMNEVVDYVKTDLMPDYDYDQFDDQEEYGEDEDWNYRNNDNRSQ